MTIDTHKLPYRSNVAAIVFQGNNFLLLQQLDWPDNFWKFPQGGKDEGESDEETILRELLEETGNSNYKIIGKSQFVNKYEWPLSTIIKSKLKWQGQDQRFFLVEYLGNLNDIKIQENEIKKYVWVKKEELEEYISRKNMIFVNYYQTVCKVLEEFHYL